MGEGIVRVLLIDDDTNGSSGLREVMAHAGFEVMMARDGWTGLEYVRQRHPDAVVWAQQASGMGVQELRRLLEHDPVTETIPCLSFAIPAASADWMAHRTDCRPTQAEELVVRIHAALRRTAGAPPAAVRQGRALAS